MNNAISSPARIWSVQQLAIFEWFAREGGNLVVIARAGCGKTTTIIAAIDHAREGRILVCAFNKIIAEELSSRLRKAGAEARTLHSVGNGFVFKVWGKVQIDDRRGRKLAMKALTEVVRNPLPEIVTLVADLAGKAKNMAPMSFQGDIAPIVEIAHQFDLTVEDPESVYTTEMCARAAQRAMQLATVKDGTIDFDDMIFLPLACNWTSRRYDMVVVDEAQDMNAAQILLAEKICRGRRVYVGDDYQAIYGFRGADSGVLGRIAAQPDTKTLPLTITYRCPQLIVEEAQRFVPDFTAAPTAPHGTLDSLSYNRLLGTADVGNFVLSRTNAPLAKICLKLIRNGKRAIIRGRDIGKGLTNIIRKLDAVDMADLIGKLGAWEKNAVAVLTATEEDADANEAKIEFVQDQAATIRELAQDVLSPAELVARIESLFSDNNIGSAVICSTVHKAKGLESERVFLLKDTFFRRRNSENNQEERNTYYVGVTRAKSHLTMVAGLPGQAE